MEKFTKFICSNSIILIEILMGLSVEIGAESDSRILMEMYRTQNIQSNPGFKMDSHFPITNVFFIKIQCSKHDNTSIRIDIDLRIEFSQEINPYFDGEVIFLIMVPTQSSGEKCSTNGAGTIGYLYAKE